MSDSTAFLPQTATKKVTTVANTSVSASAFTGAEVNADTLQILNNTTGIVFVKWGVGAQTAAATDYPVPPIGTSGFPTNVRVNPGIDTVAVFVPTGATPADVYLTRGDGGV